MSNPSKSRALTLIRTVAAIAIAAALIVDLGQWLPFPDSGPIGLARIFAAHLTLLALACTPVALGRGSAVNALRVGLVALTVVAVVAFGDEWWSPPPSSTPFDGRRPSLDVATWNLEIDSRSTAATIEVLQRIPADIIGLQELTPAVAAAIEGDATIRRRFPHRDLVASDDVFGLGILSRHPMADVAFEHGPSRMSARIAAPGGAVRLIVVHPLPGRITLGPIGLPVGFEPEIRAGALGRIRETVDQALSLGDPVAVIGDINTAPTEPAFDAFRGTLVDAHREVGVGPGWTYRPSRLEALGFGLIRIDVVFTSDGLRPASISETCGIVGDHCIVQATLSFATP